MMAKQRVLSVDPCEWLMSHEKNSSKPICAIELGRDVIISSEGKIERAFINYPELRAEIVLADLMTISELPDTVKSWVAEISLMLEIASEN